MASVAEAPVRQDGSRAVEAPPAPEDEDRRAALAESDQACVIENPNPPGSGGGVMVTGEVLESCARAGHSAEDCNPDAWISARAAHCIALRHGLSLEAQVSVNVLAGRDGRPRYAIAGTVDEHPAADMRRRASYRYQVDVRTGDVRAQSKSLSIEFHAASSSVETP